MCYSIIENVRRRTVKHVILLELDDQDEQDMAFWGEMQEMLKRYPNIKQTPAGDDQSAHDGAKQYGRQAE